jgi:HSP20 family molecular chaperone IbpA
MSFLFYPDIEPYPTTYVSHTYPEKGHHLHHVPLPYMAHKLHRTFHDRDLDVHQPKADVRETLKSFYLEVELPGIKDKSELHLRWTSMRTLLVTSKTARPEIPEEELAEVPVVKAANPATELKVEAPDTDHHEEAKVSTDESRKSSTSSPSTTRKEPHLTVHERLIGEVLRAFNFPVDVDRDNTHAKLDAGLLRIIIPKVEHEQVEHVQVPVHHDEQPLPVDN